MGKIYETFAEQIRAARAAKCVSKGALAEHVQVSRQAISKIESGKTEIRLHNALAIAEFLGLDVRDLIPKPKKRKVR